jgi:ABC-type transporter MlaC component
MINLDQNKMQTVVQEAFDKVSGNRRWEKAIVRAKIELEVNPYMHWNGHALVIMSSSSNEIYEANGVCQCKAFTNGHQPCWHRAAARLIERYNETSH